MGVGMSTPLRTAVIADPDEYFRLALETILKGRLGFSAATHAISLDQALDQLVKQPETTLAIFDLNLPGVLGATSLTAVRDCFSKVHVAVVSSVIQRRDVLLAIDAGVHGYIPKSESPDQVTAALRMVLEGLVYVPPSVVSTSSLLLEGPVLNTKPLSSSPPDTLTPRQREVLGLLLKGKSNKEIARALNLGEGTVKVHMAGLFRTLGVNTRAAAAAAGTHLLYESYFGA
jgi:DNA-binding NarL/FixJ family response regulator